nr:PREDICTED: claudin-11 [Struthio camelus australis]
MVATCLHLAGFVCSFIGWIGVVVATATNDWVVTWGYNNHQSSFLALPTGYVQACRALMIAASVLGLPAIFLLITVLPCIRMGHEPGAAKYRRSQLGGILIILLGKAPVCPAGVRSGRSSSTSAQRGASRLSMFT